MASPFYDSWVLLKRRSDTAHIEDERRLEQRPGYPHNLVSQAKKPDFVRNPSGPGFYENTPRATLMTDERNEAPSETQLQSVKEGNKRYPLNFETVKFFNQSPEIYSGDDSRFTVETGHPMEIAFRLLKNDAMDYGEIASELPEPTIQQSLDANMDNPNNKLKEMLEQARNQGPAPSANLKRLPPARPPVRPELLARPPVRSPQTASETDTSNLPPGPAEVRPVYNEIGRIIDWEDAR